MVYRVFVEKKKELAFEAKALLSEGRLSVLEAASVCGFRSGSYFAKSFLRYVGVLPGEYRLGRSGKR